MRETSDSLSLQSASLHSTRKSKDTHYSADDDDVDLSGTRLFSEVKRDMTLGKNSKSDTESDTTASKKRDSDVEAEIEEEEPLFYLLGTRHDIVEKYLPTEFWSVFYKTEILVREIGVASGADWGPNVQQFIDAGLCTSEYVVRHRRSKGDFSLPERKSWEGWANELFDFEQEFLDEYMCCLPDGLDWRDVHPIIIMTRVEHFQRMHAQAPFMDSTLMEEAFKQKMHVFGMETWQDRFDCNDTFAEYYTLRFITCIYVKRTSISHLMDSVVDSVI